MDKNIPVDAVYLDFSKAFDTVPHNKLVHKLKGYGITGNVLQWISDFLIGRKQYVSVNGCQSSDTPVTSGVPQGSVLGPILFIYYINDMPDIVDCFIKIFADDAKASNEIKEVKDSVLLQDSLNNMSSWTKDWGVDFNCVKCGVMHLGKNNPCFTYTLNNTTLKQTSSEKDLGVFVDPLLNFEDHINASVKKAKRMSGLIMHTINYKSKTIMIPLFKSLVRPIIEYGNAVWSPHLRKHVNLIESVQRLFTKCIIGTKHLSYEERLKFLGLPSLEFRRFRGDLIETYKICKGVYDPATTSSLFVTNSSDRTRTNGLKLTKRVTNSSQYQHFFTNRVINYWNILPTHVVNAKSTNAFKNYIDNFFKEHMYSVNLQI